MANEPASADHSRTTCIHSVLIESICEVHGAKQKGFWAALRALDDADAFAEALADASWISDNRFIPDAFLVDEGNRTVVLYEAVTTSDVTPEKFGKIVNLALALDTAEWSVVLVRWKLDGAAIYRPLEVLVHDKTARAANSGARPFSNWQLYTMEACASLALNARRVPPGWLERALLSAAQEGLLPQASSSKHTETP